MYNSTIKRKTCKCGCGRPYTLGYNGYRFSCAPEDVLKKVGTKHDVARKNRNKRVALTAKLRKIENDMEGGDKWKGNLWFIARHLEMTGSCIICGGRTCKGTSNFKNSIAHLFAKSIFESVKWQQENFIELCFYGNSCHTNFDNKILTLEKIKDRNPVAWEEIVRKTKILYPLMTDHEKGRVPTLLVMELLKASLAS